MRDDISLNGTKKKNAEPINWNDKTTITKYNKHTYIRADQFERGNTLHTRRGKRGRQIFQA